VSALAGRHRVPSGPRLKRVALVSLMAVATVNLWTGGPLLALWIGSLQKAQGPPSMLAVGVAAVSLGAISYALVKALAWLDAAYGRAAGRTSSVSRHVPWLRSMRGERPQYPGERAEVTALEQILVIAVVLAVLAFEIWFFFFSGSPIDQRSGR